MITYFKNIKSIEKLCVLIIIYTSELSQLEMYFRVTKNNKKGLSYLY
ncbi:hypothetical protein BN1326_50332 [Staphylococcus argenteus]|uniref:Uncharacterized protein n=1 Tax=Staphylococcus argenteus TaxID=985002 RepID=A0A7U7JTH9_9STAP|nr:hypothetical protein BN1326_50332 [Staphylococcus argenteus]CRI24527.1 hypothetical protein BN1326_50332 [Staphylococcus argenteus]